nr:MAG TPA: hypothetical protein [Caudoviricetes sp.]
MPRVTKICNPDELGKKDENEKKKKQIRHQELEHDIALFVGGICLTVQDVKAVLRVKDDDTARKWLKEENILPVKIRSREHYLARDIAKALKMSQIRA